MVIPACYVGLGLWYMKKVEEHAAEKSTRPSKIDWVEAGVVSRVVRKQNGCGKCLELILCCSMCFKLFYSRSWFISSCVQVQLNYAWHDPFILP
jgi:hypothetical protein